MINCNHDINFIPGDFIKTPIPIPIQNPNNTIQWCRKKTHQLNKANTGTYYNRFFVQHSPNRLCYSVPASNQSKATQIKGHTGAVCHM